MDQQSQGRAGMTVGVAVFAALMVLTVIEWLAAIYASAPMLMLLPVALAKAWIILAAFMHVRQLRRREEVH